MKSREEAIKDALKQSIEHVGLAVFKGSTIFVSNHEKKNLTNQKEVR